MRTSLTLLGMGCVLCGFAAPAFADSHPGDIDARIVSVEGEVTVFFHDQGSEGVPAAEGMPLEAGDRVTTGAESRAELGIDGNSVMDLGPGSDLTVASVERKASAFSLALGSLLAKIQAGLFGDGGTMEVRTPTAVAAVRGTEFAVENGASGADVGVFDEGKVAVRNPGARGEVLLGPNQETVVQSGLAPAAPRKLEHFAARRQAIAALRRRAAGLRGRWRALSKAQRANSRRQMFQRRQNLIRQVHERQRQRRIQRQMRRSGQRQWRHR